MEGTEARGLLSVTSAAGLGKAEGDSTKLKRVAVGGVQGGMVTTK